jgi:hypothetical protein
MMRFLRLSSLLFLSVFVACASQREVWPQYKGNLSAMRFKPEYERELYRCVVDGRFLFKKFHLSGLLLFKELEDGTRVVFQNEMGITFFDFQWDKNDSFKVNQIIEQLDRPAVIKTLEKDFNLLLMKRLDESSEFTTQKPRSPICGHLMNDSMRQVLKGPTDDVHLLHRFKLNDGHAVYIEKSARLMWIGNIGKNEKAVNLITLKGQDKVNGLPDKVLIEHFRANFSIQLTKIAADVNE